MPLFDVLSRHFRFAGGLDNLPILATPRPERDKGRLQLGKVMDELGLHIGIEIGTRHGGSAKIWCEAMPGLDLTCVDPFIGGLSRTQKHQDAAYQNALKHAEEFGFKLLKMKSMEAVDLFADGSVDFVHIDGDHTFDVCVQDIVRYVPKVRPGGLILIHDYCTFKRAGVMQAVDAYTHSHRIDPWYVTRDCNPVAFWERGIERA